MHSNTYIPLCIAFINADNMIEKISYISPHNSTAITSGIDCDRAIEANYDFFTNNNVKVGDIRRSYNRLIINFTDKNTISIFYITCDE